jgi:hypothetical protein
MASAAGQALPDGPGHRTRTGSQLNNHRLAPQRHRKHHLPGQRHAAGGDRGDAQRIEYELLQEEATHIHVIE